MTTELVLCWASLAAL